MASSTTNALPAGLTRGYANWFLDDMNHIKSQVLTVKDLDEMDRTTHVKGGLIPVKSEDETA